MNWRYVEKKNISQLPKSPGVYAFKNGRAVLYIGKSANLRERVKNHFQQPVHRDNFFINQTDKIGYLQTGSEIEALLLEMSLIKKYQPKYNVIWRDDKNYFYVAITKESLPRVFITHQTSMNNVKYIGPFVDGSTLKETLNILRKIFPYCSARKHPKNFCLWCHLNLCSGPNPDKKKYQRNIRNLTSILEGRSKKTLVSLKKEMADFSKKNGFEAAAKTRDQIETLEKILFNARIFHLEKFGRQIGEPKWQISARQNWEKTEKDLKKLLGIKNKIRMIEAYDISNIQGKSATGSMVAFSKGQPDKNSYRKFRIRLGDTPNDTAMIREILTRRFSHEEWPYPDLILIDGGKAQLNAGIAIAKIYRKNRSKPFVISLAKRNNELFAENLKKLISLKETPAEIFNLILRIRDEAHRFAVSYHRQLRQKALLKR